MSVLGLHHISLISTDAQRTLDFYTGLLGLRLVKRTVNFDNPGSYHLYFGNETGHPGTLVTVFPLPRSSRGQPGIGGTHHFALQVENHDGLLQWKRRLSDQGVAVTGPFNRHYFSAIAFRDPDGTNLEIASNGPGWAVDEEADALGMAYREPPRDVLARNRDEARPNVATWPDPVPTITPAMRLRRGIHHVTAISSDIKRTHAFYAELLGMNRVKKTADLDDPRSAHWYWGVEDGAPGPLVTYVERDPRQEPRAKLGAGQTHHFALSVADEASQLAWREKLLAAGNSVTPVLDRLYFKSIYTRDPDGHIVELATAGPGFLVDEAEERLGETLKLPPWLEPRREQIRGALPPLQLR